MNLSLCGINYKSASLQKREPLQLNRAELPDAVSACKNIDGVLEAAILTTCNRVEFYLVLRDDVKVYDVVRQFYMENRNIDIEPIRTAFYTYQGSSTARQLYKVTSGVDSMVLGETQIQGQVKEAYRIACSVKGPGKILHKLFHIAFRAGKEIRSRTEIGSGSTTVGGVALEMLCHHFGDLSGKDILCIGVSPMTEIVLNHLTGRGVDNITIINRTYYKAEKVAASFGIKAKPIEKLGDCLAEASIVISATGAPGYMVENDHHGPSLKAVQEREIVFVDMAVPRDIDPAMAEIPGISIIDLEDIKFHLSQNKSHREEAVNQASEIAENYVREFMSWQKNSAVEPLIRELIEEMEDIRRTELDSSKRKVPVEQWDELERLSQALLKKIVDLPIRQLKDLNLSGDVPHDPVKLFRELFKLKSSPESIN
ncbi:MAG: glutamyl-tRNA reductase [candidate division Zixibacteria bacterium]|nr:glutamyl-tRNA reductase [candidate division Zixibacteria bacterium]